MRTLDGFVHDRGLRDVHHRGHLNHGRDRDPSYESAPWDQAD